MSWYAAYETKTKKELCMGVWQSMAELARALGISQKSAWCNFYRTRRGRAYSLCGFEIRRLPSR